MNPRHSQAARLHHLLIFLAAGLRSRLAGRTNDIIQGASPVVVVTLGSMGVVAPHLPE